MTATAPAHRAAPHMTHTPDPETAPQSLAAGSAVEAGTVRPRLRDQIAENPLVSLVAGLFLALMTFLGAVVVALLVFALTSMNDRFDSLERRMDRLEDKVDTGFAEQGAQIAELDARLTAQIAELDRKLTALVAHLNATAAVDAALEHRLLIPEASPLEPEGEPSG